jgi:hypothetical protein
MVATGRVSPIMHHPMEQGPASSDVMSHASRSTSRRHPMSYPSCAPSLTWHLVAQSGIVFLARLVVLVPSPWRTPCPDHTAATLDAISVRTHLWERPKDFPGPLSTARVALPRSHTCGLQRVQSCHVHSPGPDVTVLMPPHVRVPMDSKQLRLGVAYLRT